MSVGSNDFVDFANKCPTQYHLLNECVDKLSSNGFEKLSLSNKWSLQNGKSYYIAKPGGLYAFTLGSGYVRGNGVVLGCGQIDGPGLVVKPIPDKNSGSYLRFGVAIYGTANLHTWFDRDLTFAGRVFVRRENPGSETKIETHLICVNKAMVKIPSLAIHFNSGMNQSFEFNHETNLNPIYAIAERQASAEGNKENLESEKVVEKEESDWHVVNRQGHIIGYLDENLQFRRSEADIEPVAAAATSFYDILAEECKTKPEDIIDFDLSLVDYNQCKLWGRDKFVSGAKLESVGSCYSLINSLIEVSSRAHNMIHAIFLVEGTENTSQCTYGAGSRIAKRILERIMDNNANVYSSAIAKSCFACVSGALAVNPNYGSYHELNYLPKLDKGPVLNYASRVNFITNSYTAVIANMTADMASIEIQSFLCKNWAILSPSVGTAFGLTLGMNGFDIGIPLLANGSIRETTTQTTIEQMQKYLTAFFTNYASINSTLN